MGNCINSCMCIIPKKEKHLYQDVLQEYGIHTPISNEYENEIMRITPIKPKYTIYGDDDSETEMFNFNISDDDL